MSERLAVTFSVDAFSFSAMQEENIALNENIKTLQDITFLTKY